MSGASRMFRSTDGSIFFASAKAAALSSTADKLVKNWRKIGTDALYIEIVMAVPSSMGCMRNLTQTGVSSNRSSQDQAGIARHSAARIATAFAEFRLSRALARNASGRHGTARNQ